MSVADPVRFHCEQSRSDSCVAACTSMALARLGLLAVADMPARERQLAETLFPTFGAAALELKRPLDDLDPNERFALSQLLVSLAANTWWIIEVHAARLHHVQQHQAPRPRSEHGFLSSSSLHHTIILVASDANQFKYLDPFFPARFQPLRITRDELVQVWTGRYVTIALPPVNP